MRPVCASALVRLGRETPHLVALGIPPPQDGQGERHVVVPEDVECVLHVAAREAAGQGHVREPARVVLTLHSTAQVEDGAGQLLGYVEQPHEADLVTTEDGEAGGPDDHRQEREDTRGCAGFDGGVQLREREDGDVRTVRGGRVVELRGEPGVVQRLPVTPYDVIAGVVGHQLEYMEPRHQGSRAGRCGETVPGATVSAPSGPASRSRASPTAISPPSSTRQTDPPRRRSASWAPRPIVSSSSLHGAATRTTSSSTGPIRIREPGAVGTSPSSRVRLRRGGAPGPPAPQSSAAPPPGPPPPPGAGGGGGGRGRRPPP